MATEWFKKTKAERQGLSAPLSSETFNSGTFSRVLETLAAVKRSEREQVAMVELMLYQMFKPNSKRTKIKEEEVSKLRKQIIHDKWRNAIHSTITREGIREKVEARKRARGSDRGSAGSQGIQRQASKTGAADTSTGVWHNWQRNVGLGSMQSQIQQTNMNMYTKMSHPFYMPGTMHTGATNFSPTYIHPSMNSMLHGGLGVAPYVGGRSKHPLQGFYQPWHVRASHREAPAAMPTAITDVGKLSQRDIDALPRLPPAACAIRQEPDHSGPAATSEETASGHTSGNTENSVTVSRNPPFCVNFSSEATGPGGSQHPEQVLSAQTSIRDANEEAMPSVAVLSMPLLPVNASLEAREGAARAACSMSREEVAPESPKEGAAVSPQEQPTTNNVSTSSLDMGRGISKPVAVSAFPPIPVNFSTAASKPSPRTTVADPAAPLEPSSPRKAVSLQTSRGQSGSTKHLAGSDPQQSTGSKRQASSDLASTQASTNPAVRSETSSYQRLTDPSGPIMAVPKVTAASPRIKISGTDNTSSCTSLTPTTALVPKAAHITPKPASQSGAYPEITSCSISGGGHHQSIPVHNTATRTMDRLAAVHVIQSGQSEVQAGGVSSKAAACSDTAVSLCSLDCADGSARSRSPTVHASPPFPINISQLGQRSSVQLASASNDSLRGTDQPRSPSLTMPTASASTPSPGRGEASVHIHGTPPFPVNSVVQSDPADAERLWDESQSASVCARDVHASDTSAGSASTAATKLQQSNEEAAVRDSMQCHAGSGSGEHRNMADFSARCAETANSNRVVRYEEAGDQKTHTSERRDSSGMTWQQWRAQQAQKQQHAHSAHAGGSPAQLASVPRDTPFDKDHQPGTPSLDRPTTLDCAASSIYRGASVHVHCNPPFPVNTSVQSASAQTLQSESQSASMCSRSAYASSCSAGQASTGAAMAQPSNEQAAVCDSMQCHAGSENGERTSTGNSDKSAPDPEGKKSSSMKGKVDPGSEEACTRGQDLSGMTWQQWRARQMQQSTPAPHADRRLVHTSEIQPAPLASTFPTSRGTGTSFTKADKDLLHKNSVRWGEDTVTLYTVPSSTDSMLSKRWNLGGDISGIDTLGWSGQRVSQPNPGAHSSAPLLHSAPSPLGMNSSNGSARSFATSPLPYQQIGNAWSNVPSQVSRSPILVNSGASSDSSHTSTHVLPFNTNGSYTSSTGPYRSLGASAGLSDCSRSLTQTSQQQVDSFPPSCLPSTKSSSPNTAMGASVDCISLVSCQTSISNSSGNPARTPVQCNIAGRLHIRPYPDSLVSEFGSTRISSSSQRNDTSQCTRKCVPAYTVSSLGCYQRRPSEVLLTKPLQGKLQGKLKGHSLAADSTSCPLVASPATMVDVTTGEDQYITFPATSNSSRRIAAYPVQLSLGSVGTGE